AFGVRAYAQPPGDETRPGAQAVQANQVLQAVHVDSLHGPPLLGRRPYATRGEEPSSGGGSGGRGQVCRTGRGHISRTGRGQVCRTGVGQIARTVTRVGPSTSRYRIGS